MLPDFITHHIDPLSGDDDSGDVDGGTRIGFDAMPPVSTISPTMPDGSPVPEPESRNAPCPCGSGRKYKHCHGQVGLSVRRGARLRRGRASTAADQVLHRRFEAHEDDPPEDDRRPRGRRAGTTPRRPASARPTRERDDGERQLQREMDQIGRIGEVARRLDRSLPAVEQAAVLRREEQQRRAAPTSSQRRQRRSRSLGRSMNGGDRRRRPASTATRDDARLGRRCVRRSLRAAIRRPRRRRRNSRRRSRRARSRRSTCWPAPAATAADDQPRRLAECAQQHEESDIDEHFGRHRPDRAVEAHRRAARPIGRQ